MQGIMAVTNDYFEEVFKGLFRGGTPRTLTVVDNALPGDAKIVSSFSEYGVVWFVIEAEHLELLDERNYGYSMIDLPKQQIVYELADEGGI